MGIFDRARDGVQEHADQTDAVLDRVVDRLGDEAEPSTGKKRRARLDRGADVAEDERGDQATRDGTPEPDRRA